jgi:hypothetical protein
MDMTAVVWFNGPSQKKLIYTLPPQTLEVGCNFIERYRPVHHVCAYDIPIVQKISMTTGVQYHTRPDATRAGWNIIRDHTLASTNSGCLAVYVALQNTKGPVYIIGCDWGTTDTSTQDELYGKGYTTRKYTNSMRRKLKEMSQGNLLLIVNDQQVDVDLPHISTELFLSAHSNK